jgi:NAD(P)-dependent dehydrogenase (short-subunit alcohol dehydrogenase family)
VAELSGKIALVTGGASGIGQATAERLSAEGAHVLIGVVDRERGRPVAAQCKGDFLELDVSDPARWAEVAREARERHGGLDIAFLNAGITTYPATPEGIAPFDIATLDLERYRRILGVNLDGVVLGFRAVVPAIEAHGGGVIVATASVAGLIGFAPDPVYTATKHAVVGLVRSLAPPLEARRIRVHAVCPGGVATRILGPEMGKWATRTGAPLMPPSQIAEGVMQAVRSPETGGIYVCLHGREPQRHRFALIEGMGGRGARGD